MQDAKRPSCHKSLGLVRSDEASQRVPSLCEIRPTSLHVVRVCRHDVNDPLVQHPARKV